MLPLLQVKRLQFGKNGIPFVVTHDGRTIRYPDPEVKVRLWVVGWAPDADVCCIHCGRFFWLRMRRTRCASVCSLLFLSGADFRSRRCCHPGMGTL